MLGGRLGIGLYGMRAGKDAVLFRLASFALSCGFTPNVVTAFGLCFGIASGAMFAYKLSMFGFAFVFLSVFCDVLDGTIARKFHMETMFGRVFDAVADRTAETAVVIGALAGGIIEPIGLLAIVGSVSLLLCRALAYARGLSTDYVLFGRVERLALILCGLIAPLVMVSTLCFVAAGALGLASSTQIIITLLQKKALHK